jgi:adenylylsulfate kinase
MNIFKHESKVSQKDREKIKGQKSLTIWMSGLSGSGKSTIANMLEQSLNQMDFHTYILDGDNTRLGLNKNLGFTEEDRVENIRRVAEVCKLMNDAGIIVICSFISPFQKNRDQAKEIIGKDNFIEVFIDTDLEVCEMRDPKGLYKKARAGEIKDFTGISSPFEIPTDCFVIKNNKEGDLDINVKNLMNMVHQYQQQNNISYVG